jgi:DNA polymerase III delta prime subunit
MTDMKIILERYFDAGYPGIAIRTHEETRAMADVIAAAKEKKRNVITWSATEGLRIVMINGEVLAQAKSVPQTEDLLVACAHRNPEAIYILRDISSWPFERDPILPRALRDMLQWAPSVSSCVVIIGPEFRPHITAEKLIVVMDYTLPTEDDLKKIAKGIAENAGKEFNGNAGEIVRALSGLSTTEAENACALSLVEEGLLDPAIIYREKIAGVKKSGLLEIVVPDPRGLSAIGGLDLFKEFISERAEMFKRWKEAIAYGLSSIKGVLLVGPPGTGKSLSAKVIGELLNIPMLRWDVSSSFASLVGETERRTRDTLALADAMAPCGLWLDEIDKAFAGSQSSGSNDSGVGKRMFGTVLTWMAEKKTPVFLFATANDVRYLPSALYRKGRFDEIFALDLPNRDERMAIFAVHLAKRNRARLGGINLGMLADVTKEFVGAEIEAVIEAAMFRAFSQHREVTQKDIIEAVSRTVPLSTTASTEIDAMRDWAKKNATPASSGEVAQKEKTRVVKAR